MSQAPDNPRTASPTIGKRRLVIGSHFLLQVVLATALVVMVNWLVWRHYVRFDWTQSRYYALAEKTKQVLGTLAAPLDVVVFIPEQSDLPYIEKVLQDVRTLLKEFKIHGGDKLRVEYVDPQRDLARAKLLVEKYGLDSPDVVIFASGDRHKYVSLNDMVELDRGDMYQMAAPRVTAFKGEGEFLAAIQAVTQDEPAQVYFLTGHGERDPENFDPEEGLSTLATYIKRDNITVAKWNLLAQQELPGDADALVIAGPQTTFLNEERELLERYLRDNGRLLLLLDPLTKTALEPWLLAWGIQVDDNLLMARGGSLFGTELLVVNAIGVDYAAHPITARLEGINTSFPYARSVRRAPRPPGSGPDGPQVTELVKAPAAFWGESDPRTERAAFETEIDLAGPLSLAAAVETSKPQGVDIELGLSRMVVIGTSRCVDNGTIGGLPGNIDFVMNALNWLLQRDQLIAVAPKQPREFSLSMSPSQVRAVYYLTIGGLPLAVAVIGIAVWLRRRS